MLYLLTLIQTIAPIIDISKAAARFRAFRVVFW